MVMYMCSVLDEGRCNEETRRCEALPDNEDAVLTALNIVLDTLYENQNVVRKMHVRALCRLVKACVAGQNDETGESTSVRQVCDRVQRRGWAGGGVRRRGKVVHKGDRNVAFCGG